MIFGQFIASKIRFFLKNHAQNAMEILFPDPFLKDKKAVYIQSLIQLVFMACQVED